MPKLKGIVSRFSGNGRKLGYPTANLHSDTTLEDGVYFGLAELGNYKKHPAIIFIGTPTTVGDTGRRVEAHLFDIEDRDYYGETLELETMRFWRANKTFESVDQLLVAMKADEDAARMWFN